MTHAVKLAFFFIISVALHGAGLWAAAGRYEAHEPEVPAGVAIVDRDLFFRHAERTETRASNPVSASDRITPRSASTVQPREPDESIARAPAEAAGEAEPERRAPASPAPGAMARLDLSMVEPAPSPRREASASDGMQVERRESERRAPVSASASATPAEPERRAPVNPAAGALARLDLSIVEPAPAPRREASAPDGTDAEPREPVRMSAVDATAPPAALRRQARLSVPAPVPARTSEALAPAGAARQASLVIAPPLRRAGDAQQAARGPAPETPARTAADAVMPGTVETIAKAPPASLQAQAPASASAAHVERGEPEAAQAVSAAEAPRLAPPGTRAPADVAARDEIASRPADRPVAPETSPLAASVTAAAPTADPTLATAAAPTAAAPASEIPAPAPRARPTLRGTLPAPLLAARQPQAAQLADAPPASPEPTRGEGLRLRPSMADDVASGRATMEALLPAPSAAPPSPSAPDPAPVSRAAPDRLAALGPESHVRRLEKRDQPSGRDDPADRFTRAYEGGECFFPLRLASRDGAAIRGYGLQAESVDMFRQAFAQALGTEPEIDWRPLTDAQCGGISFTRLVLGDAAPSVGIALERKELDLGQSLAGRVTGSRLEFVTLLVVDDSGVVHNVLDHLTPENADLTFDIPVQPVDDGTDKVQLLMAVGASRPLATLASTTPVHSDDFFPTLRDQAVEAGAHLELGLEDFVIRGRGS